MAKGNRVVIYKDEAGLWRWRAVAGNNRVIGAAEQGFRFRWYAARKARSAFPDARVEYANHDTEA
jgi:uncharacterized protein YegP (UPF0339 family)